MDDLIANITEMLNSEEGMKNLKEMAGALGLDLGTDGGEGKTADSPQQHNPSASGGLGDIDMNMILGLQKVLSALLRALKPHLSEKRAGRVDHAIKIMKLIDLLPVLRESGVLGGLLG